MNYTFLPGGSSDPTSPLPPQPTIIMTTNPQSLKTQNLLHNPRVSLLVHDWVSHRPPTTTAGPGGGGGGGTRGGSPPAAATRSSLASLLLNINTSALSSISTTITGEAVFLDKGSAEEKWCKEAHLANNTFGDQAKEEAGLFGGQPPSAGALERGKGGEGQGNCSSSCYIEGEDVRVVIVRVREGRIADWKGGVKDWLVVDEDEHESRTGSAEESAGDGDGCGDGSTSRGRRSQGQEKTLVNGVPA
jgi:Pyridoxamine 5'-phosphate oxidase